MIPSFGEIFGEPIPAYFTLMMVAFAVCTWFSVRWAKRLHLDHEVLIDLALVSLISGVAGARIAHVLFDGFFWDYVHMCTDPSQVGWPITQDQCDSEYVQGRWDAAASVCRPTEPDCFAWAKFWQGGLTWYGGLIGGVGYAMYFLRKEGFPRIKALDLGGIVLPVGLMFGRIGCFLGGCCFGLVTEEWYGMSFPAWSPASESQWRAHLLEHPSHPSLPVIPTQLLESFGCGVIALIVVAVVRPRQRFDGMTFCVSMILYAMLRFSLEFLRADDRGGMLGLSTSQLLSLVIVAAVAALWPLLQRWSQDASARALGEISAAETSPRAVGSSRAAPPS